MRVAWSHILCWNARILFKFCSLTFIARQTNEFLNKGHPLIHQPTHSFIHPSNPSSQLFIRQSIHSLTHKSIHSSWSKIVSIKNIQVLLKLRGDKYPSKCLNIWSGNRLVQSSRHTPSFLGTSDVNPSAHKWPDEFGAKLERLWTAAIC